MSDAMMRALVIDGLGQLERLAVQRLPVPEPGEGEVRLRVEATGFGFVDGLIAAGRYQIKPAVPYIPGAEIVGIVDKLGPQVDGVSIGHRVASWQLVRGGGAADYAISPADTLVALPGEIAPATAAAMLLDYLTAHYALFDRGALREGEIVLVLGAGGGVGAAAVQLAARAGAQVIAAASSAAKRERAVAFGAKATIDHGAADWRGELRQHCPDGVDVVVDPIGGSASEAAFRSLAKGGRHLVLGFASGQIAALPTNLPLLKSAALIGVDVRYMFEANPARAREIWRELFDGYAAGILRSPDIAFHWLDEPGQLLPSLASRERLGKAVLLPGR